MKSTSWKQQHARIKTKDEVETKILPTYKDAQPKYGRYLCLLLCSARLLNISDAPNINIDPPRFYCPRNRRLRRPKAYDIAHEGPIILGRLPHLKPHVPVSCHGNMMGAVHVEIDTVHVTPISV